MDMISFGSIFLELVFGHVPKLPGPGEEVLTDDFAISCGGAVTSAGAAARAGAQTGLCTVLADDLGSRVVEEYCARAGVDLSPSLRVPGKSAGISAVLNFDGDRAFVTHIPPRPDGLAEIGRWRSVLRRDRPRQGFQILREHFAQVHGLIVGEQDVALAGRPRQILQIIAQRLRLLRNVCGPDVEQYLRGRR